MGYKLLNFTMFNTIVGTRAVGAGAASCYSSGSDQKMRLLAAPEHCFLQHIFIKKNFRKKLAENLLGSGSGSGRFRKTHPDPVKNLLDPQH
jgi:hypothetical protein